MDPNANLKEQREIAADIQAMIDRCDGNGQLHASDVTNFEVAAARLAELVEALDQWITRGGFLPDVWQRKGISKRQFERNPS